MAALLIVGTLFTPATALTDDEKTIVEVVGTKTLMDIDSITFALVEIDYGNTMNMWFVPKSSDEDTLINSIGSTVGVYVGACKSYPDISDLNLMVGTKSTVAGKMYCKRAWADEVSQNTDGSYNTNEMGLVALRVLGTFKKTS